jgi:hypothetical protein
MSNRHIYDILDNTVYGSYFIERRLRRGGVKGYDKEVYIFPKGRTIYIYFTFYNNVPFILVLSSYQFLCDEFSR